MANIINYSRNNYYSCNYRYFKKTNQNQNQTQTQNQVEEDVYEYSNIELFEEKENYVIRLKGNYESIIEIYIDKIDYLFNKIINKINPRIHDTSECNVEYTNESVILPQELIDSANKCIEKCDL